MKHTTHGCLVLACALVVGCGPSPAARQPVKMVRVPADQVVEGCACDDDDDDDDTTPPRRSVQYVPIESWQPPPSVQHVESRIAPRGNAPPDYVAMPALTLHKPIAPTTFVGRRGYWY